MTFFSTYSTLFFRRIFREVMQLKAIDSNVLTAMLFSFAYVLLVTFVDDHFGMSLFFLSMTLYLAGKQQQGVDVPVLVKNPVNPDLELWIGALQRINQAGIKKLGAIHRGFSSFDKKIYRNLPMWQIPIELHRRIPQLPIICDPSHIGGRRDLIAPLCQQAMDLGFDGLIVESHCNPDDAWSDAKQQVTPEVLDYILSLLVVRDEHYSTEGLHQLRGQIDECDNQLMDLLAKRMRVCREIGTYKKEHNMTIVQTSRYNEILDKRGAQAALCGMSPEFAAQIFEHIHEESVRQQLEILNQK